MDRISTCTSASIANAMGMVGIILLDLDEKVVEINQAAVDFLGLEREEAIGRTRQSLFESGFSDRTTGQITRSQDSSIIEYSLYPNRLEDQVVGYTCILGSPMIRPRLDLHSPPTESAGVCIEGFGDDRSMQERIAQQRAEMLHASRLSALGMMSAALSHELNQPLSAIANYASACEAILRMHENDLPDSIHDFVRRIIEQSLRAGEIVRRLRDFSRKSPTRLSTTNLNTILLDTFRLMTVDLRWRNVRLDWELCETIPDIQADSIQLQQVFVNLVTNAADALQNLEPQERVITIRTSANESYVIAYVEDRGSGIRSDILHRLFEPFVSTKAYGSGIGLSICQAILEAHGGDIRAENLHPRGSVFIVRIPYNSHPPI